MPMTPCSRRHFLRLTGLGAIGLTVAACGGTETAAPAAAAGFGPVSVQLSWIKNIEFGGEYFADSKGYYTEAGIESVDLGGLAAAVEAFERDEHRGRGERP